MTCRICYEDEPTEKLIRVCDCRGSAELVHEECIIRWIKTSRRHNCEICLQTYNLDKILYPWAPFMYISGGVLISIAHAFFLKRQIDHFPDDYISCVLLDLTTLAIQVLL